MSSETSWIKSVAAASLNPPQVENALSALAAQWDGSFSEFLEDFPLGEEAFIHLLAMSTICAERLERDLDLLRWLSRPEISASDRGPRRMLAELNATSGAVAAENFRPLRAWKGREMTRIALREVAGIAALEETTAELSWLAEVCLATVYRECNAQLRAKSGAPSTEFTILGLGKLGGSELNHSSDIDLMFLYGEEGFASARLTNHEWHNRLIEQILKPFAARDPALFRVDLRLRPEGSAGPLTRSLESTETYYAGFGETWERLALMKARRVCGSEELAYEFLRQHQPFIFPRTPTPELLDEIAAIKRRIEREVPANELNVKLGAGGIREIEFVVQTLQFIHGARHAFLQEPGTLKALRAIAQLELLSIPEIRALDHAYRFLRQVEHRLQIEAERQTHTVPEDPVKRERLARSLGFPSAPSFVTGLRDCTTRVREIFQRLIAADTAAPAVRLDIFSDQARAGRALEELAQGSASFHVAPRTRQIFRKLRPLLLGELVRCADPDAALIAMVRFVEAFGLRSLLLELLATNPKLLELLVRTFDASVFATDLLVRRPQLLEEITRSGNLNRAFTVADHQSTLRSLAARSDIEGIRGYRQAHTLRIIMRDVLVLADLQSIFHEISALAEACVLSGAEAAGAGHVTIVAMGKFGGCELTYGSDLDLMLVGEDHRAAQSLVSVISGRSAEGVIAPIDARLRPEGEKGPLISSLEAFEKYYRDRAQLWELQALTRARPFAGPDQTAFREIAHAAWSIAGRRPDLFANVNAMLERIRRERGSGNDALDFKTGKGGIVEAEFLVQALQMHYDVRETSMSRGVKKLGAIISDEDADVLARGYEFLRRIESVVRRHANTTVCTLPESPEEQQKLATRLGFKTAEELGSECDKARVEIHRLYLKHMRITGGT